MFACSNIVERFKTIGNLNLLICQNDQVIILQSPNETSNDPPYDNFFSCFKDTGQFSIKSLFFSRSYLSLIRYKTI